MIIAKHCFGVVMCFLFASANAAIIGCPKTHDIHYDTDNGKFISRIISGVLWKSSEMVVPVVFSQIDFLGAVASGLPNNQHSKLTNASVTCSYRLGRVGQNDFSLNTSDHFVLGKGWKQLKPTIYICPKEDTCFFEKQIQRKERTNGKNPSP